MTALIIIAFIFSNVFSWLVGWSFSSRFKSAINFVNYLQKKDAYKTSSVSGHDREDIYAKDYQEAVSVARIHKVNVKNKI